MKKSVLTLGVCGVLLLCSCNSSNKPKEYFKEYNFKQEATELQRQEVYEGIYNNAVNLSGMEVSLEEYNNDSKESRSKTTTVCKLYEDASLPDNFIMGEKMTFKSHTKENGISLKESKSAEGYRWDTGKGYVISSLEVKEDNNSYDEIDVYSVTEGATTKETKLDQLYNFMRIPDGDVYITNKGNYAIVYSNINRRTEDVGMGGINKELVRITRSQEIVIVSKDYKVLSSYTYYDLYCNADLSSGRWFDSETLLAYEYTSYKYSYGKRASKSVESLNSSVKNKHMIINVTVDEITVDTIYNAEENTYTIDDSTPSVYNDTVYKSYNANNILYFTFGQVLYETTAQTYELKVTSLNDRFEKTTIGYPVLLSAIRDKALIQVKNGKEYIIAGQQTSSYRFTLAFNGLDAKIVSIKLWD